MSQKTTETRITQCPICGKEVNWSDAPARPFCSDRCKIIDLGAWASEERSIPMTMQDELFDEDKPYDRNS